MVELVTLACVREGVKTYHDGSVVVHVHQDTVLRELLLHEQDLLGASDDEVAAGVVETLLHARELRGRLVAQDAFGGVQHDGELTDAESALHHDLIAEGVFDIDEDGRRVGETALATLHRGDLE